MRGFTLVEVLIGLAIFTIVAGSVYSGYSAVIDVTSSSQFTSAALSIMESRVEMVRNMRYEDVGTVGGVPAGTLPQTEIVDVSGVEYELTVTIRNVDDPFDGTVFGSPSLDLSPSDYKLAQFDISCATECAGNDHVSMATYVAEKRLENEDRNGHLLVTVIDATGEPVQQATVQVINPAASPPIDITTTTDNAGQLLLLSVATGSAAYEIIATDTGYSTDRTYPPDNPANALKPHATVATQQLTQVTMVIDKVSTLTVQARDRFCAATGPFDFQLTGAKLIGELPDVPKYSAAHSLSVGGALTVNSLEWDTYTATPTDASLGIVGASGSLTFELDPDTTRQQGWVVAPRTGPTALITVTDDAGAPLNDAIVSVTGTGYDRTQFSGQWSVSDTDWSDGHYSEVSANMDATTDGLLTLENVGGIYATGSAETLTSLTFDLGTSDATLHTINWTPASQSADTSVRIQIAANNDNTTWDFVGPDGTASSFFDTPGSTTPAVLNGKRYVRYRVYLETTDENSAPTLEDISTAFASACLMDGHATFDGLTAGSTYTVTVTASGYQAASGSFVGPTAWTHVYVPVTPQ